MTVKTKADIDQRDWVASIQDSTRTVDLRLRVRKAMEESPDPWDGPKSIDRKFMSDPLPVRKARAIALKLSRMPDALWDGQLIAGSVTLEKPRIHAGDPRVGASQGFPDYLTEEEEIEGRKQGLGTGCFGHIVPDYPRLLQKGLTAIRAEADAQRPHAENSNEIAFLDSVCIALDGVVHFAERLARRCDADAQAQGNGQRSAELRQMAENLRQVPAGPAQTFWQALQSVWLLHMIFHSTMNRNAVGRLDQYAWPYLEADLGAGRIDMMRAAELVDCFCLKFNERAKATDELLSDARDEDQNIGLNRSRHRTSSQFATRRDQLDATNHWLQNIIISGLTPDGDDGTNPLSYLLLRSYRLNRMTNPLLTVRVHRESPQELLEYSCEVLKDGGGMPAFFNDEALVPALENIGIPAPDARDYTNDGCWEIIVPGRTDFRFQRCSLMLCLERALNRGRSRLSTAQEGPETGSARTFESFTDVWDAFTAQLEAMLSITMERVIREIDSRSILAPVPLLSALIEGTIAARRDMTAGGAKFRTYALLAESAAHTIDSLTAIKTVVFDQEQASMADLCDALEANFEGYDSLRAKLLTAPKYGNDDPLADTMGRDVLDVFTSIVNRLGEIGRSRVKFPCGVGTFSWYVGIGQGLGASPDGRKAFEPVSSNLSPALGRDREGLPAAILSYSNMPHCHLPAGGPLDLRISRRLVDGDEGTARMTALVRSLVDQGGAMMTLTVADVEELRAAQLEPDKYKSLRVRMGGWCAYFTMLSKEQQEHHIHRQEAG